MAGTMNGLVPALFKRSRTEPTIICRLVMPRLPMATAMFAPGLRLLLILENSSCSTARTSTGEDFGKCCRTASIRGREGEGMGERVRRILTGAISEGTHAGEEAPRHSYYQADAVDGVSNIRNNFYEAEDEPDEHHSDSLRMNEEPRSRVKSA